MNNKTLTIAAYSSFRTLLATGAVVNSGNAFAGGHHYKKTVRQTTAQQNQCGNGSWPLGIFCQTLGNQINGNHNAVNVIGVQPSGFGGSDHGNDHKDYGSGSGGGDSPSGGQSTN